MKAELLKIAQDLEEQRRAREEAEKSRELQDRLRATAIMDDQRAEAEKVLAHQRAEEAQRMAKEAAREAAEVKLN